jgi:predicted nucleotidyltransferase
VTLDAVREELNTRAHLFRRAYIYGSTARGEADEHSDVDLILVRETDRPFFDRIRDVMDLVFALGSVDLLIYTPDELAQMLREPGRFFLKDVVREAVIVEGQQGRRQSVAQPS